MAKVKGLDSERMKEVISNNFKTLFQNNFESGSDYFRLQI